MSSEREILASLRQVPLFGRFKDRHLKTVARSAVERTFPAGRTVIEEGDEGVAFYLIVEGQLEVRKGETMRATLGPGDYFGEMALLAHQPRKRTASVVAKTEVRCLVLPVWDFRGILESNPDVALQILEAVADRLYELETGSLTV